MARKRNKERKITYDNYEFTYIPMKMRRMRELQGDQEAQAFELWDNVVKVVDLTDNTIIDDKDDYFTIEDVAGFGLALQQGLANGGRSGR